METSWPSSDTWMWPSSPRRVPLAGWTTRAPMRFITRSVFGPVTWLAVGWTIWRRAAVVGRLVVVDVLVLEPPHPVRVTAKARMTGRVSRVSLAAMVAVFLHGRNNRMANPPETPMVLAASALVHV